MAAPPANTTEIQKPPRVSRLMTVYNTAPTSKPPFGAPSSRPTAILVQFRGFRGGEERHIGSHIGDKDAQVAATR